MSDGKEESPHQDTDSDTDDAPSEPSASPAFASSASSASSAVIEIQPSHPWKDTSDPPPLYEPEKSWICCTTYKDASKFRTVLHYLDLSAAQKQIIETRYLPILQHLQKRVRNHGILFFIGHFVITVGSLFVPALLSIQNSDKEYALTAGPFNVHMYWATFAISLLVTMWNAILTLFRIDKKYYFLNTTLERLRSEGWQYVALTGRYSGHLNKRKPTHQNQFVYFAHYVERIKMKQIEEEYYRTDEKTQAPTASPSTAPGASGTAPAAPGAPGAPGAASTSSASSAVGLQPHSLSPPMPFDISHPLPMEVQASHDYLRQSQTFDPASSSRLAPPPVFRMSSPLSPSYRSAPAPATATATAPAPAPTPTVPVASYPHPTPRPSAPTGPTPAPRTTSAIQTIRANALPAPAPAPAPTPRTA